MEKIIIVCQDGRKFLVCVNRRMKMGENDEKGTVRIKSFRTNDKFEGDESSKGFDQFRNLLLTFNHIHFLIENGETITGLIEEKDTRFNWKKFKFIKSYAFDCPFTPSGIKLSDALEEIFY